MASFPHFVISADSFLGTWVKFPHDACYSEISYEAEQALHMQCGDGMDLSQTEFCSCLGHKSVLVGLRKRWKSGTFIIKQK